MDVNRRISEQTQEHPLWLEPRATQAWKQNRGRWGVELSGVVKAGVVEAQGRGGQGIWTWLMALGRQGAERQGLVLMKRTQSRECTFIQCLLYAVGVGRGR